MSRVRVEHSQVTALTADLESIADRAPRDLQRIGDLNAQRGNRVAKENARRSSGTHGKRYPNAFTVERIGPLSWEYGPDTALPQGGMSFEFGSRKQKPHLDIARSADVVQQLFARDVGKVVERLFW